jgi:hypothetical protein
MTKSTTNSIFAFLLMLFCSCSSVAQNYVIIEGRVVNKKGTSLQNAHVLNLTKKLGTITNEIGMFRIFAAPGDSMMVSFMGYKPYKAAVPKNLQYKVFSITIIMKEDPVILKQTIIRSYPPTYNLFKKEFVALKIEKNPNEKLFDKVNDKLYNPKGGIFLPGPISMLYNAFSHEAKMRRKLAELMYQDNLKEIVYDKVPKDVLIKAYHFRDEAALEQFLDFCQLPESLILNGTPYELIVAMNQNYQRYPKK